MILSWNNPLVKLAGRIRVLNGRSCLWCNERFKVERRLDQDPPPFCSDECARYHRVTRRVALGLRKAPESGPGYLPGLKDLENRVNGGGAFGRTTVQTSQKGSRKEKPHKIVDPHVAGDYSNDELAKRYRIPRLSMAMRMPVGYDCHYCGKVRGGTTRDHIVPDSRGGSNAWFNLVPACVDCQRKKADKVGDCDCLYCLRARKLHAEAERSLVG